MNGKPIALLLFHFVTALVYTYSLVHNFLYCRFSHVDDPVYISIIHKLKFLTIWDFILQVVYFNLAAVNTIRKFDNTKSKNKKHSSIDRLLDSLYAALIFPISTLVVVVFWTLWGIDRELIFPKQLDAIFPSWMNHVMHTLPLVTAILENVLVHRLYNSSLLKGCLPLFIFGLSYLGLIAYLGLVHNDWIYPLLRLMGPSHTIGFSFILLAISVGVYKIGEKLNSLKWKPAATKAKSS